MTEFHINPLSILPAAIGLDPKLTKRQLRVLIVLYSFRSNTNGNVVWPRRQRLAGLLGWSLTRVSDVTAELVEMGYLKKSGDGGRSRSVRYELTMPDPVETVPNLGIPKTGTVSAETVPKTGTETVPKTGTGIEQSSEQTIKRKNTVRRGLDWSRLPESARGDVLDDWMEHRRSLRAPITTQTAINRLCAELQRCEDQGIPAGEALAVAIDAGWRGVKAEWVKNRTGGSGNENGSRTGSNGHGESRAARVARKLDDIIRNGLPEERMGGSAVS